MKYTEANIKQMAANGKIRGYHETSIKHAKQPKGKKPKVPARECPQVREMKFWLHAWSRETGYDVIPEYRFHDTRKWRFDFAIPEFKISVEYDGLNSHKSRHITLKGFTGDTDKMNAAQALGWKVLRFTILNYKTVITELKKVIKNA